MNNEEAKALLHGYQFDATEPGNPEMAEALAQVQRDPELLVWFQQQRALDAAVRDKLQQVRVPEGLAGKILAGHPARRVPRPNRNRWLLALVASIVFLVSLTVLLVQRSRPPVGQFAAMRVDMVEFLREFPRLDLTTDRLPEVREWLHQQHPLTKASLPDALGRFPSIGCRTVKWEGRQLALVCFMVDGHVMHLFVLPRTAFPEVTLPTTPLLAKVGSRNTASWSSGDTLYLVVTEAEQAQLQRIL